MVAEEMRVAMEPEALKTVAAEIAVLAAMAVSEAAFLQAEAKVSGEGY